MIAMGKVCQKIEFQKKKVACHSLRWVPSQVYYFHRGIVFNTQDTNTPPKGCFKSPWALITPPEGC